MGIFATRNNRATSNNRATNIQKGKGPKAKWHRTGDGIEALQIGHAVS